MWKQVGLVLTVAAIGLGSGNAEARFGKSSSGGGHGGGAPSSHGGGGGGGGWGGRPYVAPRGGYYGGYYGGRGYYGGYGYYGYPYSSYYYFDPTWAWPYMGAGVPGYGRYYGYGLGWQRQRPPPPPGMLSNQPPAQMDFRVDSGLVRDGYSVNLGLQLEGQRFGFGAKLDMFNLAATDGGGGRDAISLLSLGPSVLLVNDERVKWRLNGGMDVAFAPDITMVGVGVGTGTRFKLAGPLKLEANAHLTPLPYVQVAGDAGLAVDLGSVLRLRAGYRATYLDDRGNVDGVAHRDLLAGPFAGVSLAL